MGEWKALAALVEDWSSIANTRMLQATNYTSSSRESDILFWPPKALAFMTAY